MSNITKAAQDALAELADWHWSQAATLRKAASTSAMDKPEPVQSSLTRMADWHDAQKSLIRAALQDKAAEVHGYEPAGFLLHWPAPGGGRDILWSRDGAAGHAIGCPVTEIFKATDRAAHPAPVVPDDHPLVVFAKECELGTYMEHETPMAARKAISAAKAIGITAKAEDAHQPTKEAEK